jgi:hypothetical protein
VNILSFGTSQVPSYPQNSLRLGLIDIKPVEITEKTKLGNLKVTVTKTKLQPTGPINTFEELVTLENDQIFHTISIPDRFGAQELIDTFSKRSSDKFHKDTELQTEIENLKRADRRRPFYSFLQFMESRFEKEKLGRLDIEAKRFLTSNLPLSFYNKFTVYDNTYHDFLNVTQSIIRPHEFLANCSRNSQMYARRISAMQRELGPLIDKFDQCSFAYTRLKKYVTVWNAETYEELNWPKFLNLESLNLTEFEHLSSDFNLKLKEMRMALLEHNPNFLQKNIDSKDPTTKMIGNLLAMPSSSFGGGS